MAGSADLIRHEVADLLKRAAATARWERRAAITGLGTLVGRWPPGTAEHEAIAAALVRAVGDPDPKVRVRAIRGLGRLPKPLAFPAVARAMTDDDYATREAAVRILVLLDPDRAVPEIVAILHDKRASVRSAALVGLRALPNIDSGVLAALAAGLPDLDPSVQGAAMASLRALATRSPQLRAAVTELADYGLHCDSPQRREISIELLRQLQVPGHRQRCLIALSDPDPRVRQRAERGLQIG